MPSSKTLPAQDSKKILEATLPEVLSTHGFSAVTTSSHGRMDFVHATTTAGKSVTFWLKNDWLGSLTAAGVPFGFVKDAKVQPPEVLAARVDSLVARAKSQGAQYLLMVHVAEGLIRSNYMALPIDSVPVAFRRQMEGWPKRARNGSILNMWFYDGRDVPGAECTAVVQELAVPLSAISQVATTYFSPQVA